LGQYFFWWENIPQKEDMFRRCVLRPKKPLSTAVSLAKMLPIGCNPDRSNKKSLVNPHL
jgi:hypothetical protein